MADPMTIAVVGCSRGTGLQVVQQGLARGRQVIAVVRSPSSFSLSHPNLEVRGADAVDGAALARAIAGSQAVISALGVAQREVFGWPTLYSQSGRALIEALASSRVERLIAVTSGGVEHSDPTFSGLYKWVLHPLLLKRAYDDMRKLEGIIVGSQLRWTIVRPTALTDGPLTEKYRVSPRFAPPDGLSISRADVAHFILDELDKGLFIGKTPTIAY